MFRPWMRGTRDCASNLGITRMPKVKSPKPCRNCKASVIFGPYTDIAKCMRCGETFPTGYEDEIRRVVEADCSGSMEYPKAAVARAIGYCSMIYGMATHNEGFTGGKLEAQIGKMGGSNVFNSGGTGEVELINDGAKGRGMVKRGLHDSRTGYLITLVTADRAAKAAGKDFTHIYIVFRGSRSEEGSLNPMAAGFTSDGHNVDYAANFTGRQDKPWWSDRVKIRRGFLELYQSMSDDISNDLLELLKLHPKARVIVTGHSLGAGLAVVCAHHLQYHRALRIDGGGPFCFPFCTPRAGDLAFALDFKARLGEAKLTMPGEGGGVREYNRAVNFVMSNDPVSTEAMYGFKRDRSDDLTGRGTQAANRGFVGKIAYGLRKKVNEEIIFYQTPNLYKLGYFQPLAIHQYSRMQEIFLGTALYTT